MIANYYTLRVLAHDLNATLKNVEVCEVFTQEKDELLLRLGTPTFERWIVIHCDPSKNALFMRNRFQRAKKNSIDLLSTTVGRGIESVTLHPSDRIIRFQLSKAIALMAEFFGSKANVVAIDQNGTIIDAFLRPKDLIGKPFEKHSGRRPEDWNSAHALGSLTLTEFEQQLTAIGHVSLLGALKKILPQFGTQLVKEVLLRSRIPEDAAVAQLSSVEHEKLYQQIFSVFHQLTHEPQPRIYYEGEAPVLFTLIPLQQMRGLEERTIPSIHDAIRTLIATSGKRGDFIREKDHLMKTLQQAVQKNERTLQKVEEESKLIERAGQYELHAKLIMANLSSLTKGAKEALLQNLFSPGREKVRIPLEAALAPAKNAQRLFEKAKKVKTAFEQLRERIENMNKEWETLNDLLRKLELVQTEERYREFLLAEGERLSRIGIRVGKEKEKELREHVPFRVFTVDGGFQVWVGKSNENNDLLTLKYAKPNDLWFHVRGASGSHVVLKVGTGKGEPGKQALEQAAAIAAYYSKMKTARNVPVAMTLKKYVRKPRGAPAGTVTIEREKLLFVDPALPHNSNG